MQTHATDLTKGAWSRIRRHRNSDLGKSRNAFVLSGGGIQGSVQLGMLKALIESGIRPDVIAATSVGALNGVILAQDPGPVGLDHLVEIWKGLNAAEIFPGSIWNRVVKMLRTDHVVPRTGVEKIIDDHVHAKNFEDLPIEMCVIACDLDTGEEVRFSKGAIRPALLASTALPGIFPPVQHDGRRLIDGGVVNNVPVNAVDRPEIANIYVLNVGSELDDGKEVRRPLDVMLKAFAIAKGQRWILDLERRSTDPRIHVLPRPPFEGIAFDDLSQTARLTEEAFQLTKSYLGTVAA